jgi:flagellar protein FliO/FliZ
MLELTVRLIASLAVVVGLLLLIAKVGGRRMRGRSGSLVQVVHRQPLSRSSSVSVVTVGSRVLVLGTTEQHITVLTELDPDELAADLVLVPGGDDEDGEPTQIPVLMPSASADPSSVPVVPTTTVARAGARRAGARRAGARRAAAPRGALRGGARRAATPTRTAKAPTGSLTGSVLSPDTWRQALLAAMGKAS